jgi:hypothetical protein
MVVDIDCPQSPMALITADGIALSVEIDLQFSVILPNNSKVPAFGLQGHIQYGLDLTASPSVLTGSLSYQGSNFTETSSEVGTLNMFYLQKIMDLVFGTGLVAFVNTELAKGFAIPMIEGKKITKDQTTNSN